MLSFAFVKLRGHILHLKGGEGGIGTIKQNKDIHLIYPETGYLVGEVLQNKLTSKLGPAKHQCEQHNASLLYGLTIFTLVKSNQN